MKRLAQAPFAALWALVFFAAYLVKRSTKTPIKRWPNGEPFTEGDRWADRAAYSGTDDAGIKAT